MWYTYRSFLPFFLILLFGQYGSTCDNFLIQQCIDIPIGFNSISSMKCIQLIPAQFDFLIDYSVKNYIIKKSAQCYDIVSYNSSSTTLFSNECRDICPEQYCLLFNNRPNTTIINIFYSGSSSYDSINPTTNNFLSYDYFLFDVCPSQNHKTQVFLIVVYVLAGVVGVLTIAVILQFIITKLIHYRHPGADMYVWRWLRDFIFCRLPSNNHSKNRQQHEPNPLYIIENNIQPKVHENSPYPKNNLGASSPRNMIPTTSSNNTNERRNGRGGFSNGNSSDLRPFGFSSENDTPTVHRQISGEYVLGQDDLQSNYSLDGTENHDQQPSLSGLKKLSSKISASLSIQSITNGYKALVGTSSPQYPIIRL